MRAQDSWPEHAAFMDRLAESGFVVLGGPLGDGEHRFLLVIDAESEEHLRRRLDDDPWTEMEMLAIERVEPWQILLEAPS